jgi:hypothetical protein
MVVKNHLHSSSDVQRSRVGHTYCGWSVNFFSGYRCEHLFQDENSHFSEGPFFKFSTQKHISAKRRKT